MPLQVAKIRVFKNQNGIGSRGEYSDTYEVKTEEPLDGQVLRDTALALAQMEQHFALSTVAFTRATVSGFTSKKNGGDTTQGQEVVLGFVGLVIDVPEVDGVSRVLPGTEAIVVKRQAGKRAGRPTYRHCIATQDWTGDGSGILLTEAKFGQVNSALQNYMEQHNAACPLVKPTRGSKTGLPGIAVTRMTCAGTQNRQLDNRRKKPKALGAVGATAEDRAIHAASTVSDQIVQQLLPLFYGLTGEGLNLATRNSVGINMENAIISGVNVLRALTGGEPIQERTPPALPPAQ